MKLVSLCLVILIFSFHSPLMAQKARLDHIAIYVANLQKSASFYRQVMELDTLPEPFHDGKHAWFSIGEGLQLHIIEGAEKPPDLPKRVHTCFSFVSLHPFIDRLSKANIGWEDLQGKPNSITQRPDGVQQIYFRDPDGYWIEANDAAKK